MAEPVIDMTVVDELLALCDDDDPELLVDLIRMFLEDGPNRVRSIETGATEGDLELVEQAAHSLKGSAGNLGAVKVQHLAEELQLAGRSGDRESAARLAERLRTDYTEAETALRDLLDRYAKS